MATAPFDINVEELNEDSPRSTQPPGAKIRLWPHQLALVHRCKQFENDRIPLTTLRVPQSNLTPDDYIRTQVGIIGDSVGSGKSYAILGLLLSNDISRTVSTIKTYGNNKVVMCFADQGINVKTNLLVVPHNLASQWQAYVGAFTDNLNYVMVSKDKHVEKFHQQNNLPEYDLVIVTSSFYARLGHYITSRSYKLQRVIYDEIDSQNLPHCMTIDSNFYWFVTASYGNLLCPRGYSSHNYYTNHTRWYADGLRNSGFVKDLFLDLYNNLSRDYVKALVIKNNTRFVKSSIELPEIRSTFVRCLTPIPIQTLNGYVHNEVIQSLNAGDIAQAMRLISPTHVGSEDNIIAIQIARLQRELHNAEVRLAFTNSLEFQDEAERSHEIGVLTARRDAVKRRIEGINERIREADICSICYDDIATKTIAPCCSNAYCFKCINVWLATRTNCPLCKTQLLPKNLLVVTQQHNTTAEAQSSSADNELSHRNDKMKNLELIMRQLGPDAKVIIYSAYDTTFDNVSHLLTDMQVSYSFLKGNEGQVNKIMERYKQGNLRVLLANTRYYGSGLNLENTTDIVMFHKIDSESEKQVIGRAQRYGRSVPLNVWYLLYDNEYDAAVAPASDN